MQMLMHIAAQAKFPELYSGQCFPRSSCTGRLNPSDVFALSRKGLFQDLFSALSRGASCKAAFVFKTKLMF